MPVALTNGLVRMIDIGAPDLSNNISDAGRLEHILTRELNTDYVKIPLHILKSLPSRLRRFNFKAKAVLFKDPHSWILVDLIDADGQDPVLGVAIDIGTTRIVLNLLDLETGNVIGEKGFDNPQAQIGPDVLARIHYSNKPGGLEELHDLVIDSVNSHIRGLCREHGFKTEKIYLVTGAGNTAMTHFFLGVEAFEIIKEPYIPCVNIPNSISARELGLDINRNGYTFLFPNIGSYFGGDLIAGILFSRLNEKQKPSLMVDMGTNAEIVVG
ncbi:MAG: [Fe-S]-binding protein, partial [Nitrospina sp.]|nr:[Fe-S]-binding protein [Nitrospina sp.]